MKEEHIILSLDGPHNNVLKLKPPLVFTTENVDRVVSVLDHILTELEQCETIQPPMISSKGKCGSSDSIIDSGLSDGSLDKSANSSSVEDVNSA